MRQLRLDLEPWRDTQAARELDEQLAAVGNARERSGTTRDWRALLVVSTTLDTLGWQPATLIRGNLAEELTKLKQQPGKDIQVIGSPTLVGSLLREGLLDELSLLVHPVMVGRGKRLFQDGDAKVPLRLADSKTFSTGVLSLTYRPAGG